MKAEESRAADISLFENPFDGAFDKSISELSRVNERAFKPLDDIFSFDTPSADKKEDVTPENEANIVENTTAAESQIRDADMAEIMVSNTLSKALLQAGQFMLAQANQSTQGVVSILG